MAETVLDTGVLVLGNSDIMAVPDDQLRCVQACLSVLREIYAGGRVHLDLGGEIFNEYKTYCDFSGQPGVGDWFFAWLVANQGDVERVMYTSLHPHSVRGYDEFPDAPGLATLDPSDRKFVALTCACPVDAELIVSVDRGWCRHRAALDQAGISVSHLCAELYDC